MRTSFTSERDTPDWVNALRLRLRSGSRELMEQSGERRAAVLVPLVLGSDGPSPDLLLVRRSRALRAHAGQYAFPGGAVETIDSTLASTALREAEEEIGLSSGDVSILGRLPDVRTPTGYLISPFVAAVASRGPFEPTSGEISFVIRVPTPYLVSGGAFTTVRRRARGLLITGDALVWEGHEVWGATARMLLAVRRLLNSVRGPWFEIGG